jgi:hypothetical protein
LVPAGNVAGKRRLRRGGAADWHVHVNDPKYLGLPWWQYPDPVSVENALVAQELAANRTKPHKEYRVRCPNRVLCHE